MANDAHSNFVHGWNPRPEDDRDWKALEVLNGEHIARITGTDLDKALAAVVKASFTSAAVKAWAKLVTTALEGLLPAPGPTPPTPPPPPPLPAPDAFIRWRTPAILDQGNTPHCVGFTGADFLQDEPTLDVGISNMSGDMIYYECKVIDGEPKKENGSELRSLAKALKARGRLDAYAFAATVDEIKTWVRTTGPVMMGTNWYDSMFYPDASGVIKIAGSVAGGHAWSIVGHDGKTGLYEAQNHWGTSWADHGYFRFGDDVLTRLLAEQGDALVAVELPLVA